VDEARAAPLDFHPVELLSECLVRVRHRAAVASTELMTWATFEQALAAYEAGEPPYDGIGFVFCNADPFVGIDLDDCFDPESGEVARWAQKIINRVQEGYVEISPSGNGIHIIVEGTVRDGGMRKGKVEMYDRGRFFTITGKTL
jgi:putative DNA primase/helicase